MLVQTRRCFRMDRFERNPDLAPGDFLGQVRCSGYLDQLPPSYRAQMEEIIAEKAAQEAKRRAQLVEHRQSSCNQIAAVKVAVERAKSWAKIKEQEGTEQEKGDPARVPVDAAKVKSRLQEEAALTDRAGRRKQGEGGATLRGRPLKQRAKPGEPWELEEPGSPPPAEESSMSSCSCFFSVLFNSA